MQAARENKLVLVEYAPGVQAGTRKFLKDAGLAGELQRRVVAFRLDAGSPAGEEFRTRLLLFPSPCYAFFMPYGDLVGCVAMDEVERRGEAMREALQQALDKAETKRRNSRSVLFTSLALCEAGEQAMKEGKSLFVYQPAPGNRASLLMEKDVFTLDSVADFFNRHFVCLCSSDALPDVAEPQYLFLNAAGKPLFRAQGFASADRLNGYARRALEKAKGIPFRAVAPSAASALAAAEGKGLFLYTYVAGNAHQELLRTVFADPEVTDFFEQHFVSVAVEGGEPSLRFLDAEGQELHCVREVKDVAGLLAEARRAAEGRGVGALAARYAIGEREPAFLMEYMECLVRAGRREAASDVAAAYFEPLPPDCLTDSVHWEVFNRYSLGAGSALFDYLLRHRADLAVRYGEEAVSRKVAEIWTAGANAFVVDSQFDEAGFKAYAKRLRQEKVDGWRVIVRAARMNAAEKTGDWKTYVELAEERRNEEKISDAQLYAWGVTLNRECRDESVRYRAARWFAEEAVEMQRRERQSGKIKINSYKGFFEKLVDDLTAPQ